MLDEFSLLLDTTKYLSEIALATTRLSYPINFLQKYCKSSRRNERQKASGGGKVGLGRSIESLRYTWTREEVACNEYPLALSTGFRTLNLSEHTQEK